MTEEIAGAAGTTDSPRRMVGGPARLLVAGSVLVVAALLGGAAVAAAQDDGENAPSGGGEPAADHGDGSHQHRGRGARHAHEPLTPYDERYAAASDDERAAADALLADVRATLAAYEDVDAAVAAGYRTRREPPGLFAHYLDRSVAEDGHLLDPARPNGLVYYTGGDGDPVLLGAFFVAPPGVEVPATTGDLVVWHSHNRGCPGFFATDAEPCTDVRRMVHVWTIDQVELTAPRTGRTVAVEVTDPFGAPFRASVDRVG
jgi:hypothetical protein